MVEENESDETEAEEDRADDDREDKEAAEEEVEDAKEGPGYAMKAELRCGGPLRRERDEGEAGEVNGSVSACFGITTKVDEAEEEQEKEDGRDSVDAVAGEKREEEEERVDEEVLVSVAEDWRGRRIRRVDEEENDHEDESGRCFFLLLLFPPA